MKRVFLFLAVALLLPAVAGNSAAFSAAPGAEARGFVMDLTPLLAGGELRAIAPDCAALAGYVGKSRPFVWSRQRGLRLLPTAGKGSWGTASFVSDDGSQVIGYIHTPAVSGAGFLWGEHDTVVTNNEFDLPRVRWTGLSADGRRAAGSNHDNTAWFIDEGKRLTFVPGAVRWELKEDASGKAWRWQPGPATPRADGSVPDDPFVNASAEYVAMSRDGARFAFYDSGRGVSFLINADRTLAREVLVGGRSPRDWTELPPEHPLRIYGQTSLPPLLPAHSPELPLSADAFLRRVKVTHLSRDGSRALGVVSVELPAPDGAVDYNAPEVHFAVRWAAGEKNLAKIGKKMEPQALSDDGSLALLERWGHFPCIWREGRGVTSFAEFLAEYGLSLPREYRGESVSGLLMSPDGRCFYGQWPDRASPEVDGVLPCKHVLICVGPVEKPDWKLPAGLERP